MIDVGRERVFFDLSLTNTEAMIIDYFTYFTLTRVQYMLLVGT